MKKRLRGFKTFWGTAVTVLVSREGREGDNPETMLKLRMALQHETDPHACGQQKMADCTGLPMPTQRMHWHKCMNKHSKIQGSADPCRMHWHKCLTKPCLARRNVDIGECTRVCA